MASQLEDLLSVASRSVTNSTASLVPLFFTGLALVLVLRPLFFPSKVAQALRNIPGPHSAPVLGNLVEFFTKGYHTCHTEWLKAYGPIFKYDMGKGNSQLTVADPELVQQVGVRLFKTFHDRPLPGFLQAMLAGRGLVFSRGQYWTGVRSAVTPMFHSVKLQFFGDIMHENASILVQRLKDAARAKKAVNVLNWTLEMTLDILGTSAFGVKFNNQLGATMSKDMTLVKAVTQNIEDFAKLRVSTIIAILIPPLKDIVFTISRYIPGTRDYTNRTRAEFILRESQKIIQERRKEGDAAKDRHDFLSMLTQATDKSTGKPLSDDAIRSLVFEFLGAGSETTANTIACAVYCISKHPAVEKKLVQEIDAFYSKLETEKGNALLRPTYDELAQFPYVEQVVQETLRMYPAGALASREAQEACTVGGIQLPKGTPVLFPIYAMHHNPKVFPEPEVFKPERFAPEEAEKRHPYAYIPFGLGPRMCIGHRFAMEEAKLALIRVYRELSFQLVPEKLTPGGELEIQVGLVLKPKSGVWVVPQIRSVA